MRKVLSFIAMFLIMISLGSANVKVKNTNICNKLQKIDSSFFIANYCNFQTFDTLSRSPKNNGEIIVSTKDSTFKFRDDNSDDDFFEYSYAGEDKNYNSVLILGQDYNCDYYYLINKQTNKIDTLIGYPKIFGDKYLCIESSYTDSPLTVEIWDRKNGELKLLNRFGLTSCNIFNCDESYIKDEYLYFKTEKNQFFKMKI